MAEIRTLCPKCQKTILLEKRGKYGLFVICEANCGFKSSKEKLRKMNLPTLSDEEYKGLFMKWIEGKTLEQVIKGR